MSDSPKTTSHPACPECGWPMMQTGSRNPNMTGAAPCMPGSEDFSKWIPTYTCMKCHPLVASYSAPPPASPVGGETREFDKRLESMLDACCVETDKPHERFEDMSRNGKLQVFIQEDGDAIVTIWPDEDAPDHAYSSVEFCTLSGGGQSKRVRKALIVLAEAMRRDNEERTQCRGTAARGEAGAPRRCSEAQGDRPLAPECAGSNPAGPSSPPSVPSEGEREYICKHCGLRIYLYGDTWRHYGSNFIECFTRAELAAPVTPERVLETMTFSPSPLHQSLGIAGTWKVEPVAERVPEPVDEPALNITGCIPP